MVKTCGFPPRNTLVAQKHRAISRQEKMAFSTPVGLSWDSPPPPPESVPTDGRMDAGVRTNIFHIDRLRALEFRYYQNTVYQNEPLLKQITSVSSPFSSPFVYAVSPLCERLEQTKTNSKVSFFFCFFHFLYYCCNSSVIKKNLVSLKDGLRILQPPKDRWLTALGLIFCKTDLLPV